MIQTIRSMIPSFSQKSGHILWQSTKYLFALLILGHVSYAIRMISPYIQAKQHHENLSQFRAHSTTLSGSEDLTLSGGQYIIPLASAYNNIHILMTGQASISLVQQTSQAIIPMTPKKIHRLMIQGYTNSLSRLTPHYAGYRRMTRPEVRIRNTVSQIYDLIASQYFITLGYGAQYIKSILPDDGVFFSPYVLFLSYGSGADTTNRGKAFINAFDGRAYLEPLDLHGGEFFVQTHDTLQLFRDRLYHDEIGAGPKPVLYFFVDISSGSQVKLTIIADEKEK